MNTEITFVRNRPGGNAAIGRFHSARLPALAALAVFITACAPVREPPQEVATTSPTVSYNYNTDDGLVEANTKARAYCAQYSATPSLQGSITTNSDGTKTVTFECLKTAAVVTPPPAPPATGYTYRSDSEFVQSIQSADAYCAQSGQTASTHIVTNTDGSKTVTFQCVPR